MSDNDVTFLIQDATANEFIERSARPDESACFGQQTTRQLLRHEVGQFRDLVEKMD